MFALNTNNKGKQVVAITRDLEKNSGVLELAEEAKSNRENTNPGFTGSHSKRREMPRRRCLPYGIFPESMSPHFVMHACLC